jgi:hypothetical protein
LLICAITGTLSGCSVVAVADAAVSVGATVVKTTVNVIGSAVDAVLPEKKDKEKEKK